jgi:hypothetical protein
LDNFPIATQDFAEHGVTLTPATAEDFDAHAQTILSGHAAPLLELKPYLAIVRNHNPRTVVAYAVSWTRTRRNDISEVNYTQLKFPDAVAGTSHGLALLQAREIRRGEQRLVGMGFEAWPLEHLKLYRDVGREGRDSLPDVKHLRVALDAVIFDDGEMLGNDESHLAEHFIAFVQAKQVLYRDVVVGLETGGPYDDVFAPLRATVKARYQLDPSDRSATYPELAATEVLQWQNRILLEVFRRAMRREAFRISRG